MTEWSEILSSGREVIRELWRRAQPWSCVILRRPRFCRVDVLLFGDLVLAGRDSGMATEAVGEMTLVGVSNAECRVDQAHARLQKLPGILNSNALEIDMWRHADGF